MKVIVTSQSRKKVVPIITTPDGVSLYTEEDMAEARNTQRTQFIAGTEYGANAKSGSLRADAIEWFKGEVRSGTMSKDDAEGIFNGLAYALGWREATLTTLYTVTVDYEGETIAEFSDIEADDEDSAVEEVESNFEMEDVEVSFTISYNGDTQTNSVNNTYQFDSSDLTFTATEQE